MRFKVTFENLNLFYNLTKDLPFYCTHIKYHKITPKIVELTIYSLGHMSNLEDNETFVKITDKNWREVMKSNHWSIKELKQTIFIYLEEHCIENGIVWKPRLHQKKKVENK